MILVALSCTPVVPSPSPTPVPPTAVPTERPWGDNPWPDRDCRHFETWSAAQDFFIRNGGPERDPHNLDADGDGIACEALRGRN